MGKWGAIAEPPFAPPDYALGTLGHNSGLFIGGSIRGTWGAQAWPTANKAYYFPVLVRRATRTFQLLSSVGGTGSTGNYDLGVYNSQGRKLVSKGSTAVPAAFNLFTLTFASVLLPGVYYIAFVVSSTTPTWMGRVGIPPSVAAFCGVKAQTSALPLPDTATFASVVADSGSVVVPSIWVRCKESEMGH